MSDTDIKKLEVKKPIRKLSEADFATTESVQMMITVTPPVGTTREEMLTPIFWSHVARRLKPLSEIRALPKDGAWYGIYLVTYCDHLMAKLKELAFYPLETEEPVTNESDPYYIKWISPPVGWGVVRRADKSVIKDKFKSKEMAILWKHSNLDSLGSPTKAA